MNKILSFSIGNETVLILKLFENLQEHAIGKLLNKAAVDSMKLLYLHDLIQLTWPCTSTDEYVITKETKVNTE